MNASRSIALAITLILPAALSACGSSEPARVDLARSYRMVDGSGAVAGTVRFNPVGGGEVLDNGGKVIGRIVAP